MQYQYRESAMAFLNQVSSCHTCNRKIVWRSIYTHIANFGLLNFSLTAEHVIFDSGALSLEGSFFTATLVLLLFSGSW